MPPRQPATGITTYRYQAHGLVADASGSVVRKRWNAVPQPVIEEIWRISRMWNALVERHKAYEVKVADAWAADPEVKPVLDVKEAADETCKEIQKAVKDARQVQGFAKKTGNKPRMLAAAEELSLLRSQLNAAVQQKKAATAALREVKGLRWPAAQIAISRARDEYLEDVKAVKEEFQETGGYWASCADVADRFEASLKRIRRLREQHLPAEMKFRRFDGTGTVTVQIQRELGVSPEERARVTAMKNAGLRPGQIEDALAAGLTGGEIQAIVAAAPDPEKRGEALREAVGAALAAGRSGRTWKAQTIARMTPEGPVKKPDPQANAAGLADPRGKWREIARVTPELPAGFESLPRGQRRKLARQGRLKIRTGAEKNAARTTLGLTVHRPVREDFDAKFVRLTVSRVGPDRQMHATITGQVPLPPRKQGGIVCLHTGWRVLMDDSLRVAVISGAFPLPPGLMQAGGPQARKGKLHGVARHIGNYVIEVIIPAGWRAEAAALDKQKSARGLELQRMLEETAAWLKEHPQPEETGLPSPDDVMRWKAPRRLVSLGRDCASGKHGDQVAALAEKLKAWAEEDEKAWRKEARARKNLLDRRDDAWKKIAAWLCDSAGEIRMDKWEMTSVRRRPGPGEPDDPQAAAARANAVLAAPGELRARVQLTAGKTGVTVSDPEQHKTPEQVHYGCGGELDPEERRKMIRVTCGQCNARVDQDINMLQLLAHM